ncbi:MAG: hypothetical protein LBR72_01705, partial [Oscillospiraceae bacterium]|nr:hypothetical protein [Oscillospiraceae bacterium]
MNKQWLSVLAGDVEGRHGKAVRDRLFGDIEGAGDDHGSVSSWFDAFTTGMDELGDKEFLREMMVARCPCGWGEAETAKQGVVLKEAYDRCATLGEFFAFLKTCGFIGDHMELRGSVLTLIKPLPEELNDVGACGKGCHCELARHTDKHVSDIFCYCCTIAHTGNMFKAAFGD